MFKIVDVSDWPTDDVDEQLGTKEKCWLQDRRWLFKEVRGDRPDLGEDWAEKIVEQLGALLGVPVAHVELAVRHGRRGIVSESFVPDGARLEHGNELLARVDSLYDVALERQNERYTVKAVELSLQGVDPPRSLSSPVAMSAFDVWAGYLLLDAWVAGRDRHHENWGTITTGHERALAPSFDHGNALGFQEPDTTRQALADDQARLLKWAKRGTSHHFAGKPPLTALAREALGRANRPSRDYWLEQLANVEVDQLSDIIQSVPSTRMSEGARRFCLALLILNRRRLIDGD